VIQVKHKVTDRILLEVESLSDADLSGADLSDADLRSANLRYAGLRDAGLRNADLRNADLRDADLRDANLRNADLRDADLRNADLRDADLRDADLRNANLDFSCFPLWCGGINWIVDEKLPRMLAAFICSMKCENEEIKEMQKMLLPYAHKSHRSEEILGEEK